MGWRRRFRDHPGGRAGAWITTKSIAIAGETREHGPVREAVSWVPSESEPAWQAGLDLRFGAVLYTRMAPTEHGGPDASSEPGPGHGVGPIRAHPA